MTGRRVVGVLGLVALAALLASLLRPGSPPPVNGPGLAMIPGERTSRAERPKARRSRARDDRTIEVRSRHLIRAIRLDPPAPCRGEDVTVSVELEDAAIDAKVSIAGRAGAQTVLRFDREGRQPVAVVARDWSDGIDIRKARVGVRDCDARALTITVRPVGDGTVGLEARWPSSAPAVGASYDWDFGDGQVAQTAEPGVLHEYDLAGQASATASWIVTVTARDASGDSLEGRAPVTLPNPLWLASRGETRWLALRTARFAPPPIDETGTRVLTLEVQADGAGTTLGGVELAGFACADLARRLEAVLPVESLSRATLEAAGWTEVALSLPAAVWPEPVCRAEIRLRGRTSTGRPVTAMTAVELGLADARRRVTDPALLERLREARRRLGRSQVSEEDLRRLDATRE